jgi:hypothetical protein
MWKQRLQRRWNPLKPTIIDIWTPLNGRIRDEAQRDDPASTLSVIGLNTTASMSFFYQKNPQLTLSDISPDLTIVLNTNKSEKKQSSQFVKEPGPHFTDFGFLIPVDIDAKDDLGELTKIEVMFPSRNFFFKVNTKRWAKQEEYANIQRESGYSTDPIPQEQHKIDEKDWIDGKLDKTTIKKTQQRDNFHCCLFDDICHVYIYRYEFYHFENPLDFDIKNSIPIPSPSSHEYNQFNNVQYIYPDVMTAYFLPGIQISSSLFIKCWNFPIVSNPIHSLSHSHYLARKAYAKYNNMGDNLSEACRQFMGSLLDPSDELALFRYTAVVMVNVDDSYSNLYQVSILFFFEQFLSQKTGWRFTIFLTFLLLLITTIILMVLFGIISPNLLFCLFSCGCGKGRKDGRFKKGNFDFDDDDGDDGDDDDDDNDDDDDDDDTDTDTDTDDDNDDDYSDNSDKSDQDDSNDSDLIASTAIFESTLLNSPQNDRNEGNNRKNKTNNRDSTNESLSLLSNTYITNANNDIEFQPRTINTARRMGRGKTTLFPK